MVHSVSSLYENGLLHDVRGKLVKRVLKKQGMKMCIGLRMESYLGSSPSGPGAPRP